MFWFFRDSNLELLTKVLDGTPVNGHHWLFAGALTNVGYQLWGLDGELGTLRQYVNPLRTQASLADTAAFPAAGAGAWLQTGREARPDAIEASTLEPGGTLACAASATTLCLAGGRIRVEIDWSIPGRAGDGMALPLTGDTGVFWFFREQNLEVLVKVLDARAVNGHFWVFYGALSNVEYELTVTDTVTGAQKSYRNPRGTLASASDTQALPAPP